MIGRPRKPAPVGRYGFKGLGWCIWRSAVFEILFPDVSRHVADVRTRYIATAEREILDRAVARVLHLHPARRFTQ